jgi:hypothetical protein
VVHHGQRLPLGLEACDNVPRVHARLQDFERHLAADRLRLLGEEDHTKTAFADLFQQFIGADKHAGAFGDRFRHGESEAFSGQARGQRRRRPVKQALWRVVGGEHQAQVFAKPGVEGTLAVQPGGPVRRRDFQGGQKQLF